MRARYDAAQTTDENSRHWANAGHESADAATSYVVRRTLRSRARYEVANNSYAYGIVSTLVHDTIGTGPRLQVQMDGHAENERVEASWRDWARDVGLWRLLTQMRRARCVDGEAIGVMVTNPRLAHPVKLDLALAECDRLTTPDLRYNQAMTIDGIVLDSMGRPVEYHILKHHPGGDYPLPTLEYERYPAEAVIHAFVADRPGQHRGVPELTPALPLFAQLRRYTLAVLAAAETAADVAGVLHTDLPAAGEAEDVEPLDQIELEQRMLLTMPAGWKMQQLHAEQPTTTYGQFKDALLNEIARCLNMPFNVAACNSASYNYASGRLDHQTYFRALSVDQEFWASVVLDRLFQAWLTEAVRVGVVPLTWDGQWSLGGVPLPPHAWMWDGQEHVDPQKEASAQETRLRNHTTTLAREYARHGLDWEREIRQRGAERRLLKEEGLSEAEAAPGGAKQQGKDDDEETQQEGE